MKQSSDEDLMPWLLTEGLIDEETSAAIDRYHSAKYKAEALKDGHARGFVVADNQVKFVSAVPDLPTERFEKLCVALKSISSTSEVESAEFKQKTIKTSFAFSNGAGMNDSVKALDSAPSKKYPHDKLRVAVIVGQGNFESMMPELLNHAHMVLFVDIDKNVLEHNLFMAKLLQSQDDFQKTFLDDTKNPLLVNRIKIGAITAYEAGTGEQLAYYKSTEYTSDNLAGILFNKSEFTFARFSGLCTKLRAYIQGNKTSPQGGPLFIKSDINEILALKNYMLQDADFSKLVPAFDRLSSGVNNLVKKKGKPITVQEAEKLKYMIDAIVDNRYFVSKDQRFNYCRAASRELRFESVQLNLLDETQVVKLKAVFDANNVVVSFANVTNLFYYDNEQPFQPVARAKEPWGAKGNLVKSLKLLCDLKDTIYFCSTFEKPGSQLLSSHYCEGLINYVGLMSANIRMLNSKMVGTQAMAKLRDKQAQRDQGTLNSNAKDKDSTSLDQSESSPASSKECVGPEILNK